MSFSDDFDPYAPPKAEQNKPVATEMTGLATDFTTGDVLSRSWQILRSRMGLVIGTWLASVILGNVPNLIFAVVSPGDPDAPPNPLSILVVIVSAILGIYLSCGLFTFLINLASGRKAQFKDLFRGGPIVIKVILGGLLLGVAGLAVFAAGFGILAILMQVAGGLGIAVGVIGVIGLICAASVIFTRFSQYFYLLVDREVGVIESFNLSSQLMKGRFWQYNMLLLTCGLINMLTIFSLGIGLLLTIPLSLIASAVFYLAITGQPVADPMAIGASSQEDFV